MHSYQVSFKFVESENFCPLGYLPQPSIKSKSVSENFYPLYVWDRTQNFVRMGQVCTIEPCPEAQTFI